jgi:hypothetical protein
VSVNRFTRLSALFVAVSFLGGCSIVATHEEYASYRAVRRATDDRARLTAMAAYNEHHPSGMWSGEINTQRQAMEGAVWEESRGSREGLEWYLSVYPDGAHVEQARPMLAALQTVGAGRQQEAQRRTELDTQQRAQAAENARLWVTRAVQFWTTTLLGIRNYGSTIQRIVEANADFSRAFGQQPAPECTADYCIKHYGQLYHIPVPGATRIDRHIDVYLRLSLVRGRVERAELVLPNKGFSRWYELENRTVVTDEDPEQRNQAITWALDRIQPIIERIAEGATRIDYVPEPITPLQVRGESRDTEAEPSGPQKQEDEIGELLGENQPPPQEQEVVPEQQPETMVLPVGLLSYQFRNLRVIVFAASPDDYEQGYDGIIIERARD